MPTLSVGLPVYNGARYVRQAIESILAQTLRDLELVIVDNCSTDDTREICEHYVARDNRVIYHRNERNLGLAPNFNRAFSLTRSGYFKWASYDDVLAPEFCSRCIDVLDRDRDAVLVYSRAIEIDASGDQVRFYDPQPSLVDCDRVQRFGRLITQPDGRGIQAMGVARRGDLIRAGLHGRFPCADEVLVAHLALLGRVHAIDEPLYFYRYHENQSTKKRLASERARVLVFDASRRGEAAKIKLEYMAACLGAIGSTNLSPSERLRCYGWLGRWVVRQDVRRSIAKDLMLAMHERIPVLGSIHRRVIEEAEASHHYQ
ncbi:MAG: glycosyltransferase [Vicinamibacterales bacterium]